MDLYMFIIIIPGQISADQTRTTNFQELHGGYQARTPYLDLA
jgi:hypothetical protein